MIQNSLLNVLVTKDNHSLLDKDFYPEDLMPGQIGVFDSETSKSLDTTSPFPRGYYFAVRINEDLIRRSTPHQIEVNKTFQYKKVPFTDNQPCVIKIESSVGYANTNYVLDCYLSYPNMAKEINFSYSSYISKNDYTVNSVIDMNLIIRDLYKKIKADPNNFLSVTAYEPNGLQIQDDTAWDTFISTNTVVNTDSDSTNNVVAYLEIQPNELITKELFGIKTNVPVLPILKVFALEGFLDYSKITQIQETIIGTGRGLEVKNEEFYGSSNSIIYESVDYITQKMKEDFIGLAEETENYNNITLQVNFTNGYQGVTFKEGEHNIKIYVPINDSTTFVALTNYLDRLYGITP